MIELNLFRVLQELVKNSIRHGKATEIDIELHIKESMITFSYRDNGIGFDSTDKAHKKGLGMKNIESRSARDCTYLVRRNLYKILAPG